MEFFPSLHEQVNEFNEYIVEKENRELSILFISHIFRSFGQVVFLDCPVAGVFVCVGILIAQPKDFVFGLVATVVALFMTVRILGAHVFQGILRRNLGLFGFNAVLVGLGMSVFLNWNENKAADWFFLLLAAIFFGVFSSFLKMMLESLSSELPVLTFPFNLTMTVWLTFSYSIAWIPSDFVSTPNDAKKTAELEAYIDDVDFNKVGEAILKGFSQVYLVDSAVCGLLILIGMMYHDSEVALLALLGSTIGTLGGMLMGADLESIYKGLFGFNSLLVAIVCGKILVNLRYLRKKIHKRYFCALLFSLLTVPMQICVTDICALLRIPGMTYPFCFMATLFLLIERWVHEHVKSEQIKRRSSIMMGPRTKGAGKDKLQHQRTLSAITAALTSLADDEEGRNALAHITGSDSELSDGDVILSSHIRMEAFKTATEQQV